ncbi:phospholipase D-like domain-containing protein [Shewanella colwelliana]|uniref:phospholipase D-like domain-containing protein n=1 Tax=Shewanella colwelliana TaxID=23 RepID=UPI003735EC84
MTLSIYTNTRSDWTHNWFTEIPSSITNLNVAVAFITQYELLVNLANSGKRIKVVCRLGYPTSPTALLELNNHPNIEVRYFNSKSFHPKLYIAQNSSILIGSANMTDSAMLSNQEVSVTIDIEDDKFEELELTFWRYWADSNVLTPTVLKQYQKNWNESKELIRKLRELESKLSKSIPEQTPKEDKAVETYRKMYQERETAFNTIRDIYVNYGVRKAPSLPINIEVDLFLSFIHSEYAKKDSHHNETVCSESATIELIKEWLNSEATHLHERVVPDIYPTLLKCFGSEQKITQSSGKKLVYALLKLNAFASANRYLSEDRAVEAFLTKNSEKDIKSSLAHLLYFGRDRIKTMFDLDKGNSKNLSGFGTSSIKELVGWIHAESSPIINQRTTTALSFLGFKFSSE